MTKKEILANYRAGVIELQELEQQLARTGSTGAPKGVGSFCCADLMVGTNNPAAAALQAADGVEALIRRKREELAELTPLLGAMMSQIRSTRTLMVIQRYYLLGETDASIAQMMQMSRCRVNQIRLHYLEEDAESA